MKYIITLIITLFAFNASAQEYRAEGGGWSFYNSTSSSNGHITMCGIKGGTEYCETWINNDGSLEEGINVELEMDPGILAQLNKAKNDDDHNGYARINMGGTQGTSAHHIGEMQKLMHSGISISTYKTTDASRDYMGYITYNHYGNPGTAFKINYEDGIHTIERPSSNLSRNTNSTYHEGLLVGYFMSNKFPNVHGSDLMQAVLDTLNPTSRTIDLRSALSAQFD